MKTATNMNATKKSQFAKKIEIANTCGVSYGTVNNILNNTGLKYAASTVERVKKAAEEIGFVHKMGTQRVKWRPNVSSTSGNFATREEETARMLYLREKELMTNQEIAKKIGVCYLTVLKRIGKQPKELTEMSLILRSERVVRKNRLRRNILLSRKINEFEQFKKEAEAINAHATELEAQAQRIADEAKAVREQYSNKVIELDTYRKEAEEAAKELGRSLA